MNKKGAHSGIKLLIIFILIAYAGYVGYQFISNSILLKETKKFYRERIMLLSPIKDWDGRMTQFTNEWLTKKKFKDENNFQVAYDIKDNKVVEIEVSFIKTIDWLFKKEPKKYHIVFTINLY